MEGPSGNTFDIWLIHDREEGKPLPEPRRVPLQVTADLAGVFARAALLNDVRVSAGEPHLSFTSLLAGMMTGEDATCTWLASVLVAQEVARDRIVNKLKGSPGHLESVASAPPVHSELRVSESARRALEAAQSIMGRLQGVALDVHHVAAAYPILESWHESDFADYHIDRLDWCRRLGGHMARRAPKEKWYWRAYADRASPVPLTSFSPDVYTDEDLLGIDRTVDALGLLIASCRTSTPLSIGVFGPWGSGKSFFMRHLRKRIESITGREMSRASAWAEKARAGTAIAADAPLYFTRIAQVDFNAWHYNESNLVASLVDHLFRSLRSQADSIARELEERHAANLRRIAGARRELEDASLAAAQASDRVRSARDELARTTSALDQARRDVGLQVHALEQTNAQFEQARAELDAAARALADASPFDPQALVDVALQPLGPLVARARESLAEIERTMTAARGFARRLLSWRGLAVLALCLGAPMVAWLTDWLEGTWVTVSGGAGAVVALVDRYREILQERRAAFEAKLKQLEDAERQQLEKRDAELKVRRDALQGEWERAVGAMRGNLEAHRKALREGEAAAERAASELARRTGDLGASVEARSRAEEALRTAEAELRSLTSARLLEEFIEDRSRSDQYSKQLGLLALVRRDFERLSDLISAANDSWLAGKDGGEPSLHRIVLYIDDLDRCDEKTVMRVLEAVHLLLAYPLFVCVVAVDPRWVEKCLRKRNRGLLSAGSEGKASATAGDYLEKIFQIPIWMSPIEERQRAAMVRTLFGPVAAAAGGAGRPIARAPAAHAGARASTEAGRPGAFEVLVRRQEERRDPLRITGEEATFIEAVAPLLSEKPRALKRFVNTYRLLKASIPDIDRDGFVSLAPGSPCRICLSQLALFTGQPALAPLFVQELERANGATDTLKIWFDGLAAGVRERLAAAFALIPHTDVVAVEDHRAWLADTSRFLFHREA